MLHLAEGGPFTTWAAFVQELKSVFDQADMTEAARLRIRAFGQTTSVSNYQTTFQNDITLLDWNATDLEDELFEKLHHRIRDHLAAITDKPKTLNDFGMFCIKLEPE